MSSLQNIFETIVMECSDCIVVVDTEYNIVIMNNAMKRHANRIIGIDVYEGMNLESIFSSKEQYLDPWTTVLSKRQPSKKTYANGLVQEIVCSPLIDSNNQLKDSHRKVT